MLATEQIENTVKGGLAKKRILFVDDEPNFLNGIRRMLRTYRDAWQLDFALGVDEAVAMAEDCAYDTIVSDVNMPLKTGLDLLAILRNRDRTRNVPVIILTGNAESDLKRRALDVGATDLLNKPVAQDDLVARLRSVLRLKEYQDQILNQNETLERRVRERTVDLERARRDIIWRLAKAGEFRDEETGDHVIRVACCSRALARELGLPPNDVQNIFLTSPLHDVGKIGIPDRILLKNGALTDDERAIMQRHCVIGASILQAQPNRIAAFLDDSADYADDGKIHESDTLRETAIQIIMTHHEKWDGSGYPNAIAGEAIPLCGQIVAVADVFDALRSERPYKRAFSVEETLDHMRPGRASHFAPRVYDAFSNIVSTFEEVRERFAQ
jgi:response regulator RpfG family c-di-GMP phosphodiesterase